MNLDEPDDRRQAIQDDQLRLLQAAHPEIAVTSADAQGPRRPGEPFGILFREGQLLVRPDVADDVERFVRGRGHHVDRSPHSPMHSPGQRGDPQTGDDRDRPVDADHGGLDDEVPALLSVPGVEPASGIPELCRLIHDTFGADADGFPSASPRHAFYMTPVRVLCPATEPAAVSRDDLVYPPMGERYRGLGAQVAILDTGFIASAAAHCHWLRDISDFDADPLDKFDLELVADMPDGYIDPYAGHGTFIAGVLRRVAPSASVHIRRLDINLRAVFANSPTYSADIVDEMHIPDHIRAALHLGQTVVSLSAGGPTLDNHPPLSFRGIRKLLDRHRAVLVAAAGNDATPDPFWPAALPWVTGVGALDTSMTSVADYSNTGANARVYAPGTDLVNAYACGDYECFQPPNTGQIRHFHGLARWSGTSFATPVVAALVAARMSVQDEDAPTALARLLEAADSGHVMTGVGPTLMPEYTDLGI